MNKTFNDLIGEAVKAYVSTLVEAFDKKRKPVADAAQFLWANQLCGDWTENLSSWSPGELLMIAGGRQERLAADHANAAEFVWQSGSRNGSWIQMASYEEITREAQLIADSRKEVRAVITIVHIEGSARFEFIDADGHLIKTETISGKSTTPYKRYVTLDREYDHYEVHVSGVASVRVTRV